MTWTRKQWISAGVSVAVVVVAETGTLFARFGDQLTLPPGVLGALQGTFVSSGGGTCLASLDDVFSTGEVRVRNEGTPQACGNDDDALCGLFELTVSVAADSWGPEDDPGLDDAVGELKARVAIRAPNAEALCDRWIVLDAGGRGPGWAPAFGDVPLGQVDRTDDRYGDDMIAEYNDAGYVTVDVSWSCDADVGGCSDWLTEPKEGAPWTAAANGTGPLGVASRSLALYDWAYQNAGSQRLCAHAQSAATGRLMTVLTRYGGESLFDTVVLDGGPVWGNQDWSCGIDTGPFGPRPDADEGAFVGGEPANNLDCMVSANGEDEPCGETACTRSTGSSSLTQGSNLLSSGDFDHPDLAMAVVIGGSDTSGAWRQAPLWLGHGGSGAEWPWTRRVTAESLSVRQGRCLQGVSDWRCDHWKNAGVVQATAGWHYDPTLADVGHATASWKNGADALQQELLATCELVTDGG